MPDLKVKLPDGTWYGLTDLSADAAVPRTGPPQYYRGIDLRVKTHTGWSYIAPAGYGESWYPGWGQWSDFPPYTSPEPGGAPLNIDTGAGWRTVGDGAPAHRDPLAVWSLLGRSPITESGVVLVSESSSPDPPTGTVVTGPESGVTVWSPSPGEIAQGLTATSSHYLGAAGSPPNTNDAVTNRYQETAVDTGWYYYDPATVPRFSRHRWVRSMRVWGYGDVTSASSVAGNQVDLAVVDFTVTVAGLGSWSGNAGVVAEAGGSFLFVSAPVPWQPLATTARVFVTDAPAPPSPWRGYPPTVDLIPSNTITVVLADLMLETLSTDATPEPDQPFPPYTRL